MTMRIFPAMVLIAVVGFSTNVSAAGDAAVGKVKAQTCMGCHGVEKYHNVYPTYHVPKLGGQDVQYIVAALKAYKDGARTHSTMHGNAADLSEQDMQDIAAYFNQNGQ